MIDLVSKRWIFIFISLAVIVPGVIAILLGGLKPGIDFTGGTRWEVLPKTAAVANADAFKTVLVANGFTKAQAKKASFSSGSVTTDTIVMDFPGQLNSQEKSDLAKALATN